MTGYLQCQGSCETCENFLHQHCSCKTCENFLHPNKSLFTVYCYTYTFKRTTLFCHMFAPVFCEYQP